jgi:hypothetical protein
MSELIDALDDALAQAGEDAILRRPVGTGDNQMYVQVNVRVKLTGWFPRSSGSEAAMLGLAQDFYEWIMSPSQINAAQWPGGTVPQVPPFDIDPRIPRANSDQFIIRGRIRTILFVDPIFIGGELVRINGRVEG